ncbi:M81 family metallopeptidase [Flexivirga alba]|uniref:M81 family metallopeptidase n=1 Tax=Flexivirga alba TaxID=702742 RepID=A0ABW2ALQ1_9MICO
MSGSRPRAIIVGIGTECSSFAPHRTAMADFGVRVGDRVLDRFPAVQAGRFGEVDFVPGPVSRALPGGPVLRAVYDALLHDVLAAVRHGAPWDGVLLDIHGAMLVDGLDDAEADLAEQVRDAAGGADVVLAAAMDLHGQVSRDFAQLVDLPTCYRTAPHVDESDTRDRAAGLLARALTSGVSPARAWCRIPVALPGEKTSTRVEPAASLYRSLANPPDGVWEAALWVGYAWADEPRTSAAVVVVGEDLGAIQRECARLAEEFVAARDAFTFCGPTGSLSWALDEAAAATDGTFFVSDTGDNPTAGGSGDVATTLDTLLADRRVTDGAGDAIWTALVDPDGVRAAQRVGVGGDFDERVGGCFGWPARVGLRGVVRRLVSDGSGDVALIAVGRLQVLLTTRRTPFHTVADYARIGVDVTRTKLVINKIGYLEPELDAVSSGWAMALTEGPVDQRIDHLHFERLQHPLHPFDAIDDSWRAEVEVFGFAQ